MEFKQHRLGSKTPGTHPPKEPEVCNRLLEADFKALISALAASKKSAETLQLSAEDVKKWHRVLQALMKNLIRVSVENEAMENFNESCWSAIGNLLFNEDPKVRSEIETWFKLITALREGDNEEEN